MPMAHIRKVGGESDLYHVHFLDPHERPSDPGYDRPEGGHPGNRPPGSGARPDQGLPGRDRPTDPGYGRPGGGGDHISNRPPGSGGGGIPDNELPDRKPPNVMPGWTLVLIRHDGKWKYATVAPGSAPPKPLPPTIPDNGLPDQGVPPQTGEGGTPPPTTPPTAPPTAPPTGGGAPAPAPTP